MSILNPLESALSTAIQLYTSIEPGFSLGSIPQNEVVFSASFDSFTDRTGVDPVARIIQCAGSVGLFVRCNGAYRLARKQILDKADLVINALRQLRSGGIYGVVDGRYLNGAFLGVRFFEDNSVVHTIGENDVHDSAAVIRFTAQYDYYDYSDIDVHWGQIGVPFPGTPVIPPLSAAVIINETPSGLIDGANATFTTAQPFVPEQLQIFWQGQLLDPSQYTNMSSTVITLTFSPPIGSNILVSYWIDQTV